MQWTGPVIGTPSDYTVKPSIAELAFEDAEGHHALAFVVCGRGPEVAWTSWRAVAVFHVLCFESPLSRHSEPLAAKVVTRSI